MSSRISQRIRRRRNQCRWANARSTTQRWAPSPEPCSVPPAGDKRLYTEIPDEAAVLVVVVAAVAQHHVRAVPGPASLAPHRRYRLKQRDQLGDVVAVAAGQSGGERDTSGVGDQVMLAARPAPVNGASSRPGSPFNACMWEPSTAAPEKPIHRAPDERCVGRTHRAVLVQHQRRLPPGHGQVPRPGAHGAPAPHLGGHRRPIGHGDTLKYSRSPVERGRVVGVRSDACARRTRRRCGRSPLVHSGRVFSPSLPRPCPGPVARSGYRLGPATA